MLTITENENFLNFLAHVALFSRLLLDSLVCHLYWIRLLFFFDSLFFGVYQIVSSFSDWIQQARGLKFSEMRDFLAF